ncbi:MAG: alpha/beta hydrolase [Anaerolineaceae bacterium]|nr:alpha/beta hydrolase [Anaerolineaceae bacterium]
MVRSHTIPLNGIPFYYAEVPGPGPSLVILHGLTGSHDEFLHLAPILARQAHLYLLDMRGHGRSGWTQSGYTVADYGRDVVEFLQQVVGETAVLLGHSLGAMVAAWVAANRPDLVHGLILEESPFYILEDLTSSWIYPYFASLRDYLGPHHASGGSLAQMVAYVGQVSVDTAVSDDIRQRAVQLQQFDPAALEPLLRQELLGDQDPDRLLAQITCPVHLIAAEQGSGGVMSLEDVQWIVARVPHAAHTIVKSSGHDIHLDRPQAFFRAVISFLWKLERVLQVAI